VPDVPDTGRICQTAEGLGSIRLARATLLEIYLSLADETGTSIAIRLSILRIIRSTGTWRQCSVYLHTLSLDQACSRLGALQEIERRLRLCTANSDGRQI
jgi:hypothetical protein